MSWSWLTLLLILIVAFLVARNARPASNHVGSAIPAKSGHDILSQLRVATFNIQSGKDLAGNRDIQNSARVFADVDIAGVQEVHAPSWQNRFGFGLSQTESLAQISGLNGVFAATRRRWFRDYRGNALLSGLPVLSWHSIMLPDRDGKNYRNMIVAEVRWQEESFHLINTHLHTGAGREEQLAAVLNEAAKYPRVLLLGDFNSRRNIATLNTALESGQFDDAIRLAGLDLDNVDRIDWILSKGFRVLSGKMIEKGISDHPYYEISLTYQ